MNSKFYLGCLQILLIVVCINGQDPTIRSCTKARSQYMIGYDDLICRCDEVPQSNNGLLYTLTIDLSECSFNNSARGISWRELDTIYRPKRVVLQKVEVYFADPSQEPWDSTIERIDFRECLIPNITSHAFRGLTKLKEIHFFNNFIHTIFPNAIEDLPFLGTLEFANTYIKTIDTEAINNLPNIRDIAFVRSDIEIMRRDAIKNIRYPRLPSSNECPEIDIRTNRADLDMMQDMTYRLLESTENLPLPKFGARLLFLRSTITTLSSNSINSDMFAFAIFGGNTIIHMNERALNLELNNQCEITALMLSTNFIRTLHGGALASVTSLSTATHATYLVMTNNTFEYVATKGFLIHPTLKIFTVEQNFFVCECSLFNWATGENLTNSQKEIEKLMLNLGKCNGTDDNVGAFVSTCPATAPPPKHLTSTTETVFRPWTGDQTTPKAVLSFTEMVETSSGSSFVSTHTFTLLLIVIICFVLLS